MSAMPTSRWPPVLLTLLAVLLVAGHLAWGWIPILDSANLAFHEAGHPLFGIFSERLAVYGGTLMQLLIPAACAWECYRREQVWGYRVCLLWLAENGLNISHYVADARAQVLPLVGGVDPALFHDWTEILSRWGLLHQDTLLAGLVRIASITLMVWTVYRAWQTPDE